MIKLLRKFLLTLVVYSIFWGTSFSLEIKTHRNINLKIANSAIGNFSLNNYLKNELGFDQGVGQMFLGQSVDKWIETGGEYEDIPPWQLIYLRSVNHYHNPLTEKGYSGWFFGKFLSGESSKDWAQKPLGTQNPGGCYSWHDVREYFYKGLTLPNRTDREKYFAETFRGLGQIMHLLQDASVPAHTRDDVHVWFHYEKWLQDNIDINAISPSLFNKSILNIPTLDLPIANIFDTNQYDGKNPAITIGSNIGLSEYTNANFFSEDTINSTKFPYPKIDANTPIVRRSYISPYGTYNREYYQKDCCGETNGGKGYLLSAVDYYDYWRKDPIVSITLPPFPFPILDENVYREYAQFLIPRAVGYSAGLLEYFFRGNLDFEVTDIKSNGDIEITITNFSDEPLVEGVFKLFYDNDQGQRTEVTLTPSAVLNIPKSGTFVNTFAPPPGFNPEKIMLVFDGQLGEERGAIVAKYGKLTPLVGVLFPIQTKYEVLETSEQIQTWETYPYTGEGETAKGYDKSIYIKRHRVSGLFDYLFQKNLTTMTPELKKELLKTVSINCWPSSYQIVKINNIQMNGVWTYETHFQLTGIPVTWSIESINPSLSSNPPTPRMEISSNKPGFEWEISFTSTAINNFSAKKRYWEVLYDARRAWNFDGAGMGVPPCYFSVANTVVVQNSIEKGDGVNLEITIGNDYDIQKKIPEVTGYIYGNKKVDFKDFDQLKCPEPYQDPNWCCSSWSTRGVRPCYNGLQKSGTMYHVADVGYRKLWINPGLYFSVLQWTRNHFLERIRENSCSNCSWPDNICQKLYDESVQRLDASPYNNFSFWVYEGDNTVINGIFRELQDYKVVSNLGEGSTIKNYFDKHNLEYPDEVEVEMDYGPIEQYMSAD